VHEYSRNLEVPASYSSSTWLLYQGYWGRRESFGGALRAMAVDDGRERLRQLSGRLVGLHAALLARERLAYEAAHGPTDAAELLRQVIHHEQFAWLRSLSMVIARVDEAVDAQGATAAGEMLFAEVDRLLRSGRDDAFATRYRAALQAFPEVVMAHAEVVRVLAASRRARPRDE